MTDAAAEWKNAHVELTKKYVLKCAEAKHLEVRLELDALSRKQQVEHLEVIITRLRKKIDDCDCGKKK